MKESLPASSVELAVVTGMAEGTNLRNCRRVNLTETQAVFDENMTELQWLDFGRGLIKVKKAFRYYLADWMAYGKNKFGPDKVESAIGQLGFEFEDIDAASAIAMWEKRLRGLANSPHYLVVIGWFLEDGTINKEDGEQWLLKAREHGLSVSDLSKSIKAGHVVQSSSSETPHSNRDGFYSVHGLNSFFSRWLKQAEKNGESLDQAPLPVKRQVFSELEPIGLLYLKLKAELTAPAKAGVE